MTSFKQKFERSIEKNNSLLCIGLDPVIDKIPPHLKSKDYPLYSFCKEIVEQTHDLVCAYKPNSAFFEAHGAEGVKELQMICHYITKFYPEIPIILDAKRGDIGSTNDAYVKFAYDYLGTDAITLHPYLGREAIQPFLNRKDKGCIILCRTSNPGSGEIQNVECRTKNDVHVISTPHIEGGEIPQKEKGSLDYARDDKVEIASSTTFPHNDKAGDDRAPLYQYVARQVSQEWNVNDNCLLVVGATYPEELAQIRAIVGDMTILVPGVGAQGGDLQKTLGAGLTDEKKGVIITVSRSVIYASSGTDFTQKSREEAERLRDVINDFR